MTSKKATKAGSLEFVALGGAGEIGMNLYLYGYDDQWLMVDLGIGFGDDSTPGIEIMTADPRFIVERRDKLAGLVITHAHEDHLGAVQHLWPQLKCPVYATPFAAAVLRAKLAGEGPEVPITEIPLKGRFQAGPFDVELVTLTHSIPEPNALAIRTPAGTVLHTGDWKIDPDPVIGEEVDEEALRALGEEGVTALIGDSTNIFVDGEAGSEALVKEGLLELARKPENLNHRFVVTCFATNVARLQTIAEVAEAVERDVVLVGRSLWRISEAARRTGYLHDVKPFLSDRDAGYLPPDRALYICTGSQGEPRAALARIASRSHPSVSLDPGDLVVFSSRVIPGNEPGISRVQNGLLRQGIRIITDDDHMVHVSGHPARDELARLYQWVRPQALIPVHGERRHLDAHAAFAKECQIPHSLVAENGTLVRLAPAPVEIVGEVETGILCVDGTRLVPMGDDFLKSRRRALWNGTVMVTVVLGRSGPAKAETQLSVPGLDPEETPFWLEELRTAANDVVAEMPTVARRDDAAVIQTVRQAVRRKAQATLGKKPVTEVHVVRI